MISCKQATQLICKKEENRLSFIEKVKLRIHLSVCRFCCLFESQTNFIEKNACHLQEHLGHLCLSDSCKEKIISKLKGAE